MEHHRPAWKYVAEDLADMFEYYSKDGHVSSNVANAMGDLFETVPLDHRQTVFIEFLNELDTRNIPYNKQEFNSEEMH